MNIKFFWVATFSYLGAMVFYLAYLAFRNNGVGKAATLLTYFGFVAHTVALGVRWWESYKMGSDIGHIPVSNLFESMSFGAWTIVLIYMAVEWNYKNKSFGAFVMPVAFLALAYIGVAPNISKDIEPLVPALKSYWLHIHVITSFLGYAAFAVSFGVSLMYMIVNAKEKDTAYGFWTACLGALISIILAVSADAVAAYMGLVADISGKHMLSASFRSSSTAVMAVSYLAYAGVLGFLYATGMKLRDSLARYQTSSDMLDEVGYKTIAIGFPLLTVGIITGAVWANAAWGTYWGWDPKETWSLITWLVYAAYLHARLTRGWRGVRAASLSVFGFASVIFTYLGVNLLLSGLHAYGATGGEVDKTAITFLFAFAAVLAAYIFICKMTSKGGGKPE
ncbi:MAG: c-type cytochrome biogenesis protein CcsB [Nitrospirae bacterium]|nr:c-type cytochrome biogenesis protein CcsB [Nitrospirota bacterium]